MPFNLIFEETLPERRGSYPGVSCKVDAAGNHYFVYGWENVQNANLTEVRILKLFPDGRRQEFREPMPSQWKIDRLDAGHSGRSIVIDVVSHTYTDAPAPRKRGGHSVAIDVGFVTTTSFESEEGGSGAFVGEGGGDPVPGITPAEIEAAVRRVLGVPEGRTLFQEWGANPIGKWRQVLEDKAKSAAIELLVDQDPDEFAQIYQHLAFNFHKNAAANPLANVLGESDDWGAARAVELRNHIRQAISEPEPETLEQDSGAEGEPTE